MGGIDKSVFDQEFTVGVINFLVCEFVTESDEGVSEHFCVDFAVDFESLEGLKDGIVIISASGHFFCEKHDHLCEVDWTRGLRKHALGLTIGDGFADGAESSNNVAGGQETVLIGVHDTEGFFELLDLPLREESKHIGATLLGFFILNP